MRRVVLRLVGCGLRELLVRRVFTFVFNMIWLQIGKERTTMLKRVHFGGIEWLEYLLVHGLAGFG